MMAKLRSYYWKTLKIRKIPVSSQIINSLFDGLSVDMHRYFYSLLAFMQVMKYSLLSSVKSVIFVFIVYYSLVNNRTCLPSLCLNRIIKRLDNIKGPTQKGDYSKMEAESVRLS